MFPLTLSPLIIYKPDVLVICELRCDASKLQRTFSLLGYDGFCFSPVQGFAGGIIIAWKQASVDIKVLVTTPQFIHTMVTTNGDKEWHFTAMYASPYENKRKKMWHQLDDIAQKMQTDWMIAGDMNDIANVVEKKGGGPPPLAKIIRFNDDINKCSLRDLGAVGSEFTWKGPHYHDDHHIFKRLDRALSNDGWRIRFPDVVVKVFARVQYSDHHPLLIIPSCNRHMNNNPKFRFESSWLTDPSYKDFVDSQWNKEWKLNRNLLQLSDNFREWHKRTFGEIKNKKKELS